MGSAARWAARAERARPFLVIFGAWTSGLQWADENYGLSAMLLMNAFLVMYVLRTGSEAARRG